MKYWAQPNPCRLLLHGTLLYFINSSYQSYTYSIMLRNLNYTSSVIFIALWWLIALKNPAATQTNLLNFDSYPDPVKQPLHSFTQNLLKLNRKEIKKGLEGHVHTMAHLICEWDIEAEFLEQSHKNIKRLPRQQFIRSQILSKILLSANHEVYEQKEMSPKKLLIDALGVPLDLNISFSKIFPQTYLSAGILLALAHPHDIVALPKGMRRQNKIYSQHILDQVELDIENYQSEKIFKLAPNLAIVSPLYSHPSTLQTLKNQGIKIFNMDNIRSIEDLKNAVDNLGHISRQQLKSELLNIFIEASLNAIDNKRSIQIKNFDPSEILLVNYHTQYSLPGKKTLIFDLIKRLGSVNNKLYHKQESSFEWSIPIKEEDIISINPEHLFIITSKNDSAINYFYQSEMFQFLKAAKCHQVVILDEEIQHTPSQLIVLAYYDINNGLTHLYE